MMVKASVIIRAYNCRETIARAVESVLLQNFQKENFEVVIVNDGSKDGTRDVLSSFERYPQIKIIDQENCGAIEAANRGFRESTGEYVVLLDSDDAFEPDFLKTLVTALDEKKDADFAYTDYYEDFDGTKRLVSPKHIWETLAGGILFRRVKIDEEGFYSGGVFFAEYDLLLRTLNRWKSYHVLTPLFTYYRRRQSLTADADRVERAMRQLQYLHPERLSEIAMIRRYKLS